MTEILPTLCFDLKLPLSPVVFASSCLQETKINLPSITIKFLTSGIFPGLYFCMYFVPLEGIPKGVSFYLVFYETLLRGRCFCIKWRLMPFGDISVGGGYRRRVAFFYPRKYMCIRLEIVINHSRRRVCSLHGFSTAFLCVLNQTKLYQNQLTAK